MSFGCATQNKGPSTACGVVVYMFEPPFLKYSPEDLGAVSTIISLFQSTTELLTSLSIFSATMQSLFILLAILFTLVPFVSAHGYVKAIAIDGQWYSGNPPNNYKGELIRLPISQTRTYSYIQAPAQFV